MPKKSETNKEDFDRLLDWLDENREVAATKYEAIRLRLIKIFVVQKHFDAEDLADLVFDRATKKISEISQNYQGAKEAYFYGIARKIHLEAQKKPVFTELKENVSVENNENDEESQNLHYQCLDHCLQKLSPDDQDLIVSYYKNEKQAKIDYRKQISEKLGINLNFLRIKVFRLRSDLKKCVLGCVKNS